VSRCNLTRLGGLAAVVGGVLSAAASVLTLVLASRAAPTGGAQAALLAPLISFGNVVSMFFLVAGLMGLCALLGRHSKLGISGIILACLALLAAISHPVFAVTSVAFADPTNPTRWLTIAQEAALWARGLLLGCAVLLLAFATYGSRTLGRWELLPLILGLLIIVPALYRPVRYVYPIEVPPAFLALTLVLQGLCWVLLGGALWAYASRQEARDTQNTTAS
jgi:hypothetical protein